MPMVLLVFGFVSTGEFGHLVITDATDDDRHGVGDDNDDADVLPEVRVAEWTDVAAAVTVPLVS